MNRTFPANLCKKIIVVTAAIICFSLPVIAQENSSGKFPKEIRGYKVQKAKVLLRAAKEDVTVDAKKEHDSMVRIGVPQNFKFSLAGATFDLPLSMHSYKTGGRIESITFEDMRVNGIRMQVEEFNHSFEFAKGVETPLPQPLKIKIDMPASLSDVKSFSPSLTEFEITGKVYVFGTFKKFGIKFKRVIPSEFRHKMKFTVPLFGSE